MRALEKRGFNDVAGNILEMGRQRVAGDYLQPAAIFDRDFHVLSAINDVNDYTGPGTGYRVTASAGRRCSICRRSKSPQRVHRRPDRRADRQRWPKSARPVPARSRK